MSVSVLNTTAGLSGKTLALLEGSQTFTGQKTFDVGASAPFVVVSGAAKVSNLDADKLDGAEGTAYHDAAQLTGLVPATGVCVEQTYSSTGSQNDVAPSAGATVIVLCTGAAPVITGFTGGAQGRKLLLVCKGTTLKVSDQTGSSAANQIICESTQGQIVGANGAILVEYDTVSAKWRAQLVSPGAPITWTPVIGGSGGTSGQVYTTQVGRYQQRGRHVSAQFRVQLSTLGTVTTNAQIQGLPFTSQNTTNLPSAVLIGFWQNLTTALVYLSGEMAPNTTAVTLRGAGGAATSLSALAQADLANTTYLDGAISYFID